jgi:branched-chain amino acid aminotransferase
MSQEFAVIKSDSPLPDADRIELLKNPAFGVNFTDHQVIIEWTKENGWHNARVEPYGPMLMDPASAVFHYGQEIFEGIKAYRHEDGSIHTFRPRDNGVRMQKSAHRMALPELPVELFVESLRQLIQVDGDWVPEPVNEKTLYIRPFEIAAESFLGVRAAERAEYRVIASPVGPYFTGGIKPVKIWVALDSARAGRYGTGEAKTGGNYAASLLAQGEGYENGCSQVLFLDAETHTYIEELGGMNVFFVYKDGHVVTPSLSGTILRGITRDSIIQLLKDRKISVEERTVTLDEIRDAYNSGEITEIFACGTAAVVTPIGQLKSKFETIGPDDAQAGELTMSIREELTGIQYGRVQDRHNWLVKLSQ